MNEFFTSPAKKNYRVGIYIVLVLFFILKHNIMAKLFMVEK